MPVFPGNPIVWVGHNLVAYTLYFPPLLAGLLLPYLWWRGRDVIAHARGNALAAAAAAVIMSSAGAGSAFMPALWAVVAAPPAFMITQVKLSQFSMLIRGLRLGARFPRFGSCCRTLADIKMEQCIAAGE